MGRNIINRRMKFPKHYKSQEGKYGEIKAKQIQVKIDTQKAKKLACEKSRWLRNTYEFEGYPLSDYPFFISVTEDIEELKAFLKKGNWAIRQGIAYKNLCFINQIDGGDKWIAIKQFQDGTQLAFERITFQPMCSGKDPNHNFEEYIESLLKADYEECKTLNY
jgi:hypothetical protein